ncbi:hypothetical protein LK12_17590 [Novosphingobium malaysiense]|uniref:Methyltransferase n=2 Tax=Novosphingobium malaysiense TaxID=1348853 RepID=A0A0B1ZM98_9SPHN|nr:hypothetical protein LK12_17590 [Novosphingobium malaysiense]
MQDVSEDVTVADVNFQVSHADAGTFGQWDEKLRKLSVQPVPTRVVNIRNLAEAPSLDREGFALVEHDVEGNYDDRAFLDGAFVDSCVDLIKRLTGAKATLNMYPPIVRSKADAEGTSIPAGFIHLDQTRDSYFAQARSKAREQGIELHRGAIYNVWKATSKPPQDQPLAVADRRALDPDDFVIGNTLVEVGEKAGSYPYIGLVPPKEALTLYYTPDMHIGESLVFLSCDFDANAPVGSAHTAIDAPGDAGQCVPRTSVEVRILAVFE